MSNHRGYCMKARYCIAIVSLSLTLAVGVWLGGILRDMEAFRPCICADYVTAQADVDEDVAQLNESVETEGE